MTKKLHFLGKSISLFWGEQSKFSPPWKITHWKIPLSAPSDEYEKYSQGVALEYDASDEYQKDRLKMLKTLLTIPFIFSLQTMRDKFEQNARQNIQAEIEKLSKQ